MYFYTGIKRLKTDRIALMNNQGVSVFDDRLAIVQLHQQEIKIVRLTRSGNFEHITTVGYVLQLGIPTSIRDLFIQSIPEVHSAIIVYVSIFNIIIILNAHASLNFSYYCLTVDFLSFPLVKFSSF